MGHEDRLEFLESERVNRLATPTRITSWVGFLVLTVLIPGCREAASDASVLPGTTATIKTQRIDRSQRLALEAQWRIGAPGDSSEIELFGVLGASKGADGSTFVLEAGSHRIDVLDERGSLLRQFGREGDGPGEFRRPRSFVVARDTVLVLDRRRIHFFDGDGTSLATHRLRFPDPEVGSPGFVGATDEGWVVGASGYFRGRGTGLPPLMRTYLYALDPSTGEITPTGLRWELESNGQFEGILWIQPVLEHQPTAALDGMGRYLTADTAAYRVDVYGVSGALVLRIENEAPLTPIDDKLMQMWEDSRGGCPAGLEAMGECSPKADQLALSMPRSRHRPFIRRLRVHPSGHFSVLRADLDPNPFDRESPLEYDHFAPDGSFLGVTSGTIPLWFDGATMISLEPDELGIETLVQYEVGGG